MRSCRTLLRLQLWLCDAQILRVMSRATLKRGSSFRMIEVTTTPFRNDKAFECTFYHFNLWLIIGNIVYSMQSVIVKSIERNAHNMYEARRQLLGLVGEMPPPVACRGGDAGSTASTSTNSLGLAGLGTAIAASFAPTFFFWGGGTEAEMFTRNRAPEGRVWEEESH